MIINNFHTPLIRAVVEGLKRCSFKIYLVKLNGGEVAKKCPKSNKMSMNVHSKSRYVINSQPLYKRKDILL